MIVIDASVVIKWFKPDEKSSQADFILEEHVAGRESIFAPTLLLYEFMNALFYSKNLNFSEISEAINALNKAKLNYVNPDLKILQDTLSISEKTRNSIYDSSYIALAKNFNCGLITSDKKLFQGAKSFVEAALI